MTAQTTSHILMIRPVAFRYNEETAENNYYQKVQENLQPEEVQGKALEEFDDFVEKLRAVGVNIYVYEDTKVPETPDSIFPNNWITFHEDATVVLYPMYARNRRLERREDILSSLELQHDFLIKKVVNYTHYEEQHKFLEGTGSLVLDRPNKLAYACLSKRTDEEVLGKFCEQFGFEAVKFHSLQKVKGELLPIYHTNVMMSVGEKTAVLCAESIRNDEERETVRKYLKESGKEIVEISEEQKQFFAGNMLQVKNRQGKKLMVMSTQAFRSLGQDQIEKIEKESEIVHSPLDTIEACGGGSARCMMAEVFLPGRK